MASINDENVYTKNVIPKKGDHIQGRRSTMRRISPDRYDSYKRKYDDYSSKEIYKSKFFPQRREHQKIVDNKIIGGTKSTFNLPPRQIVATSTEYQGRQTKSLFSRWATKNRQRKVRAGRSIKANSVGGAE